jgi:hypothetical protein
LRSLDRALIRECARVCCSVRFELGLLTRLCFFDGAHICRDARLRAELRLSFHLGALHGEPRSVAIGFGTRCRLSGARAFGCLARAGGREQAPLGIGGAVRKFSGRIVMSGGIVLGRSDEVNEARRLVLVFVVLLRLVTARVPEALRFASNQLRSSQVM